MMQEEDFALYNRIYQSSVHFRRTFELEAQRYMLALNNSFENMKSRLPQEVLKMNALEFQDLCSSNSDFEKRYNLEFKIVDSPFLGVLDSISQLFKSGIQPRNLNSQSNTFSHNA